MRTFIEKYTLGVVILGFVVLIMTGSFFSSRPWVIIGQLVAVTVAVYAKFVFRHQQFSVTAYPGSGGLIKQGPYRVIRHPMYASVLLLIWVSILGHLSPLSVTVGIVVTTFTLMRVGIEEELLQQRYPEYAEYSRQTKRLVPFIY